MEEEHKVYCKIMYLKLMHVSNNINTQFSVMNDPTCEATMEFSKLHYIRILAMPLLIFYCMPLMMVKKNYII